MTAETHIVLCVYNGREFVSEQVRSIQDQTFRDWQLWIRDDGSTDGTFSVLEDIAASDHRIFLYPRDGEQLGVSAGFSWLLERLPDSARQVFCCDADDVWLPGKIEYSIAALHKEEAHYPGPILIHTDLQVTDSNLHILDQSLWHYLRISPEPATLERLVIENVATGPTILMNRHLLQRVCPIPQSVPHHDWWIAIVAVTFGRVVALHEATVLYRRHSANHTGEYRDLTGGVRHWVSKVLGARGRTGDLRRWLAISAAQAGMFLDRFEDELPQEVRVMLKEYSEIPNLGLFERKLRVLRMRTLPEHGIVRNLGLLLRA